MGCYKVNIFKTIMLSNIQQNGLSSLLKRNFSLSSNNQIKKKFNIVRKSYPADRKESPVVLETKDSSSVIKQLNWEFKMLFGPQLNSKLGPIKDHKPLQRSFNYRTDNLVTETDITLDSSQPGLDMVVNFPLMNRHNFNQSVFVSKANLLREDLLRRCDSKPPSVSRIMEKTMPADSVERLRQWKLRMIKELGEEGFNKYQKELLSVGSSLHASISAFLTSPGDESVQEVNEGHWRSLESVFPSIRNVRLLEERVQHPFLCYQGIVDCFAEYRDHLVVIDWKTSKKSKTSLSSTFDNPLQIAAYVGALNYDSRLQYLVKNGLIVVAYESGKPATPLFIDEDKMQRYWSEWLGRVHRYWEMVEAEKTQQH